MSSHSRCSSPSLGCRHCRLVGSSGLEPPTSRLSGARSNQLSYEPICRTERPSSGGGDDGIRTHDPLLAGQVLSQLSYTPVFLYPSSSFVMSFFESSLKIEQQNMTPSPSGMRSAETVLLRKEVIQPHLPIRLPCYDLTPIIGPTFGHFLLAVRTWTSGVPNFHGLTGGVYKARERIHRGMLIRDY